MIIRQYSGEDQDNFEMNRTRVESPSSYGELEHDVSGYIHPLLPLALMSCTSMHPHHVATGSCLLEGPSHFFIKSFSSMLPFLYLYLPVCGLPCSLVSLVLSWVHLSCEEGLNGWLVEWWMMDYKWIATLSCPVVFKTWKTSKLSSFLSHLITIPSTTTMVAHVPTSLNSIISMNKGSMKQIQIMNEEKKIFPTGNCKSSSGDWGMLDLVTIL